MKQLERANRNAAMAVLYLRGYSTEEIGQRYGLGPTSVRRAIIPYLSDDHQARLVRRRQLGQDKRPPYWHAEAWTRWHNGEGTLRELAKEYNISFQCLWTVIKKWDEVLSKPRLKQ